MTKPVRNDITESVDISYRINNVNTVQDLVDVAQALQSEYGSTAPLSRYEGYEGPNSWYVISSRPETDAEMNRRVAKEAAEVERSKRLKKQAAEIRKARELKELARLKKKYEKGGAP